MLTIRAERPDDHDAIAAIVAAAFGSPAEARLVERIRASAGDPNAAATTAAMASWSSDRSGRMVSTDAA